MRLNRRGFVTGGLASLTLCSNRPVFAAGADRVLQLVAKPGRQALMGDAETATAIWGYDGSVPGPLIRARQGERIRVRLKNQLAQPTSIHWHGIRIANAMDGVVGLTQDAVEPGESFDYDFVAPDAGTYWYHTHNRAWEQLARGLYGALIVDEAEIPDFDRDIVFILDDWRLNEDGAIDEASFGAMHDLSHAGRLGNWLTVNARSDPEFQLVSGDLVRLRVMNAANARVLNIRFNDIAPMVIALDGHALAPRPLGEVLRIAPGQRVDLSFRVEAGAGAVLPVSEISHRDPLDFATFKVAAAPGDALRPRHDFPALAPTRNPEPDLANAERHVLLMEGGAMGGMRGAILEGRPQSMRALVEAGRAWAFNGIAGDMTDAFFAVERGKTVIIEMVNDTSFPHAMHLHGHHFRALEKNGAPVSGDWRDTELVEAGDKLAVAFVADNPGKWYFHCHMMEHQMSGMRTWIDVRG